MPITVQVSGKSIDQLADRLAHVGEVTSEDILYALDRQKTRIIDRTLKGHDVSGNAFAPYSTKGPYYYYANPGVGGRRSAKSRSASAARYAKKLGGTRTRLGVKFDSYAAFKASLGRGGIVDLLGVSAPHMLQSIVTKTTGSMSGEIGIYGPEADRAEGHNLGTRHLPKREFFGVSSEEEKLMAEDIERLMSARMSDLL